jgi:hypothetical protein
MNPINNKLKNLDELIANSEFDAFSPKYIP